jgi:integrase
MMSVTILCHIALSQGHQMTSLPTYLYQYKQSKNYYFRIRRQSLDQIDYNTSSGYFVASLHTDDVKQAAYLALVVINGIKKENVMNTDIHTPEKIDFVDLNNAALLLSQRQLLKQKFNQLLAIGKAQLSLGTLDVDDFDDAERQRAQIVNQQLSLQSRDIPPESSDNIQRTRMLSSLMLQLCEHAVKVKNFTNEDCNTELTIPNFIEFMSATEHYQQSKKSINVDELVKHSSNSDTAVVTAQKSQKSHYSIEQLYKLFKKEKIGAIKGGSVSHYDISFDYLSELIDLNNDVSVFDETLARRIKFDLIERKDQRCKDTGGKTLSVARINAYISNFSQFCQWCIEHKIPVNLNVNPFKGLRIKSTKNSKTPRREFSAPECNAILNYEPLKKVEAKEFREDGYWFTKIGLFSGMRLNETANLLLSDVIKKEGVWCFDLKGAHLKNDNATRVIPVHSALIELGLIVWLEDKKTEGQTYLFEQIRKGKKEGGKFGFGEKISRWFNRTVLRNIGIDKTHEKEILGNLIDYHCVRHTFIFQLKRLGVDMSYIKALVGHSGQHDLTRDVYGHNANHMIINLQKAVELISYDE